jgi:hypothetical protein
MADLTITIPLDAETASAYNSASREEKKKMEALVSLWLRALAAGQYPSLQQVLDEIGCKAEVRGFTPEIRLEPLLRARSCDLSSSM